MLPSQMSSSQIGPSNFSLLSAPMITVTTPITSARSRVINIRSYDSTHQKIYSFGVDWFNIAPDQEIKKGQTLHFKANVLEEMQRTDILKEREYLIKHFTAPYEVVDVQNIPTSLREVVFLNLTRINCDHRSNVAG